MKLVFGVLFVLSVLPCTAQDWDARWVRDSTDQNFQSIYHQAVKAWYDTLLKEEDKVEILQRAVRYAEQKKLKNDTIRGRLHLLLGIQLTDRDRHQSISHCRNAVEFYSKFYSFDHFRLHSAYFHLAEKLYLTDKIAEAEQYCDSLVAYQLRAEKSYNWPRVLGLLGRIEASKGRSRKSELLFQCAYPYASYDSITLYGFELETLSFTSQAKKLLGKVRRNADLENYFRNGKMVEAFLALHHADSSLQYLDKQSADPRKKSAWERNALWRNYGIAHLQLGNFSKAAVNFQKQDLSVFSRTDSVYFLSDLASALHGQRNYVTALDLDEQAVTYYLNDTVSNILPKIFYTGDAIERLNEYWILDQDLAHLDQALNWANRMDATIKEFRTRNLSVEDRREISRYAKSFYDHAVKTAALAYRFIEDTQYVRVALTYFEANKATALEEEMIVHRSQRDSRELEALVRDLSDGLRETDNRALAQVLSDSLFLILHREQDSVPLFQRHVSTLSGKDLLEDLDTSIIQFVHFHQHIDTTLTMIFHRGNSTHMDQLDKGEWYPLIYQSLTSIHRGQDPLIPERLKVVLSNNIDSNSVVVIFPDGILHRYPIDLLLLQGLELGRDAPILHYGPSLSIYRQQERKRSRSNTVFAFAPEFSESSFKDLAYADEYRRIGLSPLHYNREEVLSIAEALGGVKTLLGPQATKAQFIERASDTGAVWHFATHAFAGVSEAFEPHIALAGRDGNEMLSLAEIRSMSIPAELVVLSTCESGLGAYIEGEGVMSLANGFIQAGAKAVVASLWPVDDRSTAQIMKHFYRHLQDSQRIDVSLQKAKVDYLEATDPMGYPAYYWAGFIAVGDMSPLTFGKANMLLPVVCASFMVLLLVLILYFRKRGASSVASSTP
ncbi:MAG: CHAT domain-containing protein [Saprospiraceae bacterium]|nr:CHAT domain-containing protein [Saprospiraceae bacterium]